MLVRDLMTHLPRTITPATSLGEAAAILRRHHFRHLPVLLGGHLTGVISDRDLQRASAAGMDESAPIVPFVSSPAITVTPETPVEQAVRLMQENKIGCLPVVGGSTPGEVVVGILTESDIFTAMIQVMGVLDPGSRVAIHLADPGADLLAVALALYDSRAPLRALSTETLARVPEDITGAAAIQPLRLTVVLGTIDPRPLIARLRRHGLTVEYPFGQDSDARPPAAAGDTPSGQPAAEESSSGTAFAPESLPPQPAERARARQPSLDSKLAGSL
jgi:acetoin utilization protein AcuB